MTVPADAFDPDILATPPLYTLNLSAAQRAVLDWLDEHGALYTPVGSPAGQIADECQISESTAYEALARLTTLRLLNQPAPGIYKISARYFFTQHPEVKQLIAEAYVAPPVQPDDRAKGPRKQGNYDARRRRTVRAVDDPA